MPAAIASSTAAITNRAAELLIFSWVDSCVPSCV